MHIAVDLANLAKLGGLIILCAQALTLNSLSIMHNTKHYKHSGSQKTAFRIKTEPSV